MITVGTILNLDTIFSGQAVFQLGVAPPSIKLGHQRAALNRVARSVYLPRALSQSRHNVLFQIVAEQRISFALDCALAGPEKMALQVIDDMQNFKRQ